MLLLILRVIPERDPLLLFYCSGDTTAHLSETLPLIDWNKLTPVFPTFTHSFKDRERKRRIISPYTQSFIPAFDSERWSSRSEVPNSIGFLPLRLNIYPSLVICTSKHTLDKQIEVSLNEWKEEEIESYDSIATRATRYEGNCPYRATGNGLGVTGLRGTLLIYSDW